MGYSWLILYFSPGFAPWRGITPAMLICVDITRSAIVTGFKPHLVWRRDRRQGLHSSGRRDYLVPLNNYRLPLKLGSPQPIRCCSATGCFSHRVHGNYQYFSVTGDLQILHQTTTLNTNAKRDQLFSDLAAGMCAPCHLAWTTTYAT